MWCELRTVNFYPLNLLVMQGLNKKEQAGRVGWRQILMERDIPNVSSSVLVRSQIDSARSRSLPRMIASFVAISLTAFAFKDSGDSKVLIAWGAVTMLAWLFLTVVKQKAMRDAVHNQSDYSKQEFRLVGANALCWLGAATFLGDSTEIMPFVFLWGAIATLMSGAAFSLHTVPRASTLYLIVGGAAQAIIGWRLQSPLLMAVGGSYSAMLITFNALNARDFMQSLSDRASLTEKTEVVSLLLREFEEASADWLWQIDATKRLTHVSPRFAHALGCESSDIEGKSILEVLAGDGWEGGNFGSGLREFAEKLKNREAFSDLVIPVRINNESRWWELSASPRLDDAGVFMGFRGVGSDVTVERASAEKISRLARYDTLTGLPNRLMINEALSQVMTEAEKWKTRAGFMMIDLDRFKAVNDTLGHPVGDRLLVRVAERLRQQMSPTDLCGRLGGDEFAVVIADATDGARVDKLASSIIDALSKPYEVDMHTLYIGASIGTAVSPRDGRNAESLIRAADLALYRSKDEGGGKHNNYHHQFLGDAENRRTIEIALRKALERGELHLVYQPLVNIERQVVEGFETLLRWTHPELGVIPPDQFIPVAEEARLIGAIGEWVLRTACEEAKNWPDSVRIAVNVSPEQLSDANFVSAVISALSHSRLPASRLELEVTESVFVKDGGQAVQILDQLLGLGVRLSLDDFGTGYSSLGYLKKTRFSTIKVDRSFVQGAAKANPESVAIIRAVVAMADSLGMTTTAEGVETEVELEMVQKFGCTKAQGWLFGRPMDAAAAIDMLAKIEARQTAA